MDVRTIIFDLDGTMYDYEACNRIAMQALADYYREKFGVAGEEFRKLHAEAMRQVKAQIGYSCAAVHNRLIRYQWMLEQTGAPLFPHAVEMTRVYWQTMLDEMQPFDGLLAWMERLKKDGVRIGVGTNMTAYIQYRKLEKLGAAPFIDWLVTSEEAGTEKPDPKFFSACIKKSGMCAQECLFVGDSLKSDVCGALAAGMRAMLYAPEEGNAPKSGGTAKAEEAPKSGSTAKAENTPKPGSTAKAEDTPKPESTAKAEGALKSENVSKAENTLEKEVYQTVHSYRECLTVPAGCPAVS